MKAEGFLRGPFLADNLTNLAVKACAGSRFACGDAGVPAPTPSSFFALLYSNKHPTLFGALFRGQGLAQGRCHVYSPNQLYY